MVVAQWNEHFRQRIADVTDGQANDEVFGDLNKMRNDIVHHGGIASKQNVGRCTALDWFSVGQPIHPRMEHVAQIMAYMGNVEASADLAGRGPWEEGESF